MRDPARILGLVPVSIAFWVGISVASPTFNLNFAVHVDTRSNYGTVEPIDAKLGYAMKLLEEISTHCATPNKDVSVCARLEGQDLNGFGSVGDGYDVLVEDSDIDYVLTNFDDIPFKVVTSIFDGTQFIQGVTDSAAFNSVVVYDADPAALAHEFGHMCGLDENSSCQYLIMNNHAPGNIERDVVNEAQAIQILQTTGPHVYAGTFSCDATGIAGYQGMYAIVGSSGVDVTFYTLWEENTASFEVRRIDPLTGVVLYNLGTPTSSPHANLKQYAISDPSGVLGAIYQVVEHQTGGLGDLHSVPIKAEGGPLSNEWNTYDTDSLAALAMSYSDAGVTLTPDDCAVFAPEYAIFCPDDFQQAVDAYASVWRSRSVQAVVFPTSFLATCGATYQTMIRSLASRGTKYFLLFGDASDHQLWADPTKWVGWGGFYNGQHAPPSQPDKDIIPTFYKLVPTSSPATCWTYSTPYFATDLPYADTDSDSLPDVIVGRIPVSSVADINAYTEKLHTYLQVTNGNLGTTAGVFTYAVEHNEVPAWVTAFAKDSLIAAFPPSVSVSQAGYITYNSDILTRPNYPDSIAPLIEYAEAGHADVIVTNSNASWRYSTGVMSSFTPLPHTGRAFISLAITCGTNDFDETEDYQQVCGGGGCTYFNPRRPLVETLLLSADRGAIAQIGPTRASFVKGNPLFGVEFIKQLYTPGSTLGRAFLLAQRVCLIRYPEYRDLFRSYCLLGDPRLGPSIISGVAEEPVFGGVRLSTPRPNPFNPITTLRFFLPEAGRASLSIYDVQGRLVRRLMPERLYHAGWTDAQWDGKSDAGVLSGSGVYFARFNAGSHTDIQRVVLLK